MNAPSTALVQSRTHRLIASRYPTVGVFDSVATREEAVAAMLVESFTNDRLNVAVKRLRLVPDQELVMSRPGANAIMAAFLHADPRGGRFTGPELGAWYASFELETAIAETLHHITRRLAQSEAGFHQTIQMRELIAGIYAEFHDIRGQQKERGTLYDPDDYADSQKFGMRRRDAGSNGLCYDSVRRPQGTNLVVFRPTLLLDHRQGDHFQYQWTGSPAPSVTKLTNVTLG